MIIQGWILILSAFLFHETQTQSTIKCGITNQVPVIDPSSGFVSGDFPWNIQLFDGTTGVGCRGSIISPSWILTSAACLFWRRHIPNFVTWTSEVNTQSRNVVSDRTVFHPLYRWLGPIEYEAALVHLATPLIFNQTINSICLPWRMIDQDFEGSKVVTKGLLRSRSYSVLSNKGCEANRFTPGSIKPGVICAYDELNGPCDSFYGSTLDYLDPSTNQFYALAITPWSLWCGVVNSATRYTRITSLLQWIKNATGLEDEPETRIRKYRFEVGYISGAPDGVQTRNILGINGQFPGPTIEAELGDLLEIEVINGIQDGQNTTIHWHGLYMNGTPFEDGTNLVNQCSLANGQTQLYSFKVLQIGTFWYHSHVHSQYTEGMWGTMIIRPRLKSSEIYTYDDELTITLSDWYHRSALENEEWFLSPQSRGIAPYPDSILLNGMGRYPCQFARRFCLQSNQKRPVYRLSSGKTYRIRLVNTSARTSFNFTLDSHKMLVIEVDGVDVSRPVQTDLIFIAPGQRYSFLIKTSQLSGRYLMRAIVRDEFLFVQPSMNINPFPNALFGEVTGVIEYQTGITLPSIKQNIERFDDSQAIPRNTLVNPVVLNEQLLSPHDRISAPANIDRQFIFSITFVQDEDNVIRSSINGTAFRLPWGKPLLMKILDGEPLPDSSLPIYINNMEVIEIVVNNPGNTPHPMHLHGHHFWIVASGQPGAGPYNPSVHPLNLNGAKRDTAMVHGRSHLVIRFVADNPGVWTFHCHIDWHNLSGMSMVFVEAQDRIRKNIRVTNEARRICLQQDITLRS